MKSIIAIFVLFVVSVAHAEGPAPMSPREKFAAECAESYPARLADAKTGLAQYDSYMIEYRKAQPAVEWFALHCRFLTELEIAIRQVDDPNAFVCDPSARGKPKGLTSELILNYSTEPTTTTFFTRQGDNNLCERADRQAGRMVLTFGPLSKVEFIEALCYQDEGPSCLKVRETIAKLREKGKVPE